jgi:hypothetical protein
LRSFCGAIHAIATSVSKYSLSYEIRSFASDEASKRPDAAEKGGSNGDEVDAMGELAII